MNLLEPAEPQMLQNFWRGKRSVGKQIPAKLKWLITAALIVFFTPLVWVYSAGREVIPQWAGLEGTLKIILFQPCTIPGAPSLEKEILTLWP